MKRTEKITMTLDELKELILAGLEAEHGIDVRDAGPVQVFVGHFQIEELAQDAPNVCRVLIEAEL